MYKNITILFSFLFQTLQDKECEWAKRNEALRKDLRQAIRSSIADTERETESLENLEQVKQVPDKMFVVYRIFTFKVNEPTQLLNVTLNVSCIKDHQMLTYPSSKPST